MPRASLVLHASLVASHEHFVVPDEGGHQRGHQSSSDLIAFPSDVLRPRARRASPPSQSFESSPHSCSGRPAAARPVRMVPQQRRGSEPRGREREIDRVVKPRGRHETYLFCTFWEKEPGPPYILKSGKKGVLARRVRVLQPQKHPQSTPSTKNTHHKNTPKAPQPKTPTNTNTPQNTPKNTPKPNTPHPQTQPKARVPSGN